MESTIAAKLYYYQLPLRSPITFNGQQLTMREGLILQLQDSQGHYGFGEIAPLPGFSHESLQQARSQIISRLNTGLAQLQPHKKGYPSVEFALACAQQAIPLCDKTSIIDTIPLLQGDNAEAIKQYQALASPALIKLKVARQPVEKDILLFTALTQLNPRLQIRCDANQAWSKPQASRFLSQIDSLKLDYIEEPTRCYQTNLQLAEKYQIALALDETLQDKNFDYQANSAIKAFVLKPTLIGSLNRVQHFLDIARNDQLQVHISSSFESIIGLQQLTFLANHYRKTGSVSLGIDTLKYFKTGLLTDCKKIKSDLETLECLWNSH